MSVLSRAAAQIRNDHGGAVSRNTQDGRRWLPVADWLDEVHANVSTYSASSTWARHAFTVARAYLKETP